MRTTVNAVNAALAEHGISAVLVKGSGYFYFKGSDVESWLDRTVQVSRVGDLSIEGWIQAFQDLEGRNQEIDRTGNRASG